MYNQLFIFCVLSLAVFVIFPCCSIRVIRYAEPWGRGDLLPRGGLQNDGDECEDTWGMVASLQLVAWWSYLWWQTKSRREMVVVLCWGITPFTGVILLKPLAKSRQRLGSEVASVT